jgi:outer membrane protein OmpA-like peptidoglycan-associated protein
VAGAVASVEGMALKAYGRTLNAGEVRVLFQKWGHRVVDGPRIGVMPDLPRIGARFAAHLRKYRDEATPSAILRLETTRLSFAEASSEISAEDQQRIVVLAGILLDSPVPVARVLVQGHTDETGGVDSNLGLSEARATAVRAALIEAGVPSDLLVVEAFGAAMPAAAGSSDAAHAFNRRVELEVVDWAT